MALLASLIDWTTSTFAPLGYWGLFILSFIESSFFPIPPDVLIVILALDNPSAWIWIASIATVGSVLGALFGYGIGYLGKEVVVKRIVSEKRLKQAHSLFEKYEEWGVFAAAFTPIPFKVVTIAAGVFYLNIPKFIIASLIGRGLRFFLVAGLVAYLGETATTFIDNYLAWFTIGILLLAVLVWFLWKKFKKSE